MECIYGGEGESKAKGIERRDAEVGGEACRDGAEVGE